MRTERRWSSRATILGSLCVALLGGCSDAPLAPGQGSGSGAAAAPSVDVDALRDELETEFSSLYATYLTQQVTTEAIAALLRQAEPPVALQRAALLHQQYASRAFAPVFFGASDDGSRAAAVVQTLAAAGDHALPVERFSDATLTQALQARAEYAAIQGELAPLTLSRADLRTIRDLLDDATIAQASDPAAALLARLFEGDPAQAPLPDLALHHQGRLRAARALAGATAIADALLMDRVLDYAFVQRHGNLAPLDEEPSPEERQAIIAERLTGTFNELASATDAAGVQAILDALPPTLPQYPLLLPALQRYRAIVAAGGWEEVEERTMRRGSRGPRVAELKQRLAAEGYYTGPIDEVFDEALDTAVRAYQETHQMEVDGETGRNFFASLNISAEDRLAQIELTMQRWRESRIGDDPYYIFVNIPDFHAEVWRNGVRDMRFRIVVGNTQRTCDTRTRTMRYANATPLQSAYMRYVVLNPYWNVPRRILEEELIPNMLENPNYFEENGIEQTETDGVSTVRLRPGPANPLGQVKFMFPNPHATYLHDTNRRNYFQFPVRAFSHGCMRVHQPLDLLEYLLTQDGQWDERDVERSFERGIEDRRDLNTPVPVHVEYYVVRVGDEGEVYFNSDIYKYDRDRLDPDAARDSRCTPEAAPGLRLVLDDEGRTMIQDAAGNLIDPSAPDAPPIPPAGSGEGGPAAGDYGP